MRRKNIEYQSTRFLGILLCLFMLSGTVLAEEKKFQWSSRLTLSEQYDDNVFLEEDNEDHDWITSVGPGLTLSILTEKTDINLDYDLGYAYYARDTADDELRHALTLSGFEGVPITSRLTLDLNESLYISDEPVERAEGVVSVRRTRKRYYRNTAGGRLNYFFGPEDSVYMGFQHVLLENDDPSIEDSQRYTPTAGITYWFDINNGIGLDFSYDRSEFDETAGAVSSDFEQYIGSFTYTYRFSPRTQTNLTYTFDSFDYDANADLLSRQDYEVHSGSLGFSHQFTENSSMSISGGYWVQDRDRRDDQEGFNGAATFAQRLERLSFTLSGSGGYRQQFNEAEDLGFSEFYQASGNLSYQFLENLSTTLTGFYYSDDYKETATDREDETWGGSAALNWGLFSWLSASLSYDYRQRDSNINANDYTDNRVALTLVSSYLSKPYEF